MSLNPGSSQSITLLVSCHLRLRHSGGAESQVGEREKAKEEVHGGVQGPVRHYDQDEGGVPGQRHQIQRTEGEGDPGVGPLQPWDPRQEEGGREPGLTAVGSWHGAGQTEGSVQGLRGVTCPATERLASFT